MAPKLEVINGEGESKPDFPDAMTTLDGKMFAGKFDKWRLQEVRRVGGSACLVDVREATPDEVKKLRAEFLKMLRLEVAE